MSANKKTLQNRFTKIRRGSGRISKIMAAVMSCVIAVTMLGGAVVMAAMDGWELNNGIIIVNGEKQTIDIKHIENSRYLNTDSYYVPLRKVFEILGCNVHYNVPKSNVPDYMKGKKSFPAEAGKPILDYSAALACLRYTTKKAISWAMKVMIQETV